MVINQASLATSRMQNQVSLSLFFFLSFLFLLFLSSLLLFHFLSLSLSLFLPLSLPPSSALSPFSNQRVTYRVEIEVADGEYRSTRGCYRRRSSWGPTLWRAVAAYFGLFFLRVVTGSNEIWNGEHKEEAEEERGKKES